MLVSTRLFLQIKPVSFRAFFEIRFLENTLIVVGTIERTSNLCERGKTCKIWPEGHFKVISPLTYLKLGTFSHKSSGGLGGL